MANSTNNTNKNQTAVAGYQNDYQLQQDKTQQRSKLLADRQAKIDAQNEELNGGADGSERGTLKSQYANPPAVRATDGKPPGTKQENPLEMAEKANKKAE